MQEVLPGLFHWRARHPKIGAEVDSYWMDGEGVLIDPLVPPDFGMDWFARREHEPVAVLLSNRHHYRDAPRFVERFGCTVHCSRPGMHEFDPESGVQPFDFGDRLPGGVLACVVDAICPDESALHLPQQRALVIADGVVRGGDGRLGFVPDSLMDEPEQTKQGLLEAYASLLDELDFEHLLLAHGGPVLEGRAALRGLIDSGGRSAFEAFD